MTEAIMSISFASCILTAWGMLLTLLGVMWTIVRHQDAVRPESEDSAAHESLRIAVQGLAQVNAEQGQALREIFREALVTARSRDAAEASAAINSFQQTQVDGAALYNERMAAIQNAMAAHKPFTRKDPEAIETPDGMLSPL